MKYSDNATISEATRDAIYEALEQARLPITQQMRALGTNLKWREADVNCRVSDDGKLQIVIVWFCDAAKNATTTITISTEGAEVNV
jgi:hypothetical protein